MRKDIDVAVPDDPPAVSAWATRYAAAQATLAADLARLGQINATLASPAAAAADMAVAQARTATADAQRALDDAQTAWAAAQAAADQFAANELAAAQSAVDTATQAVAAELARLLAEATSSTALTATIDGLALRDRYRAALAHTPPAWNVTTIPLLAHHGDSPPDPQITLPAQDDTRHYPSFMAVLARHDDRVDAIVDLITAEAVHHLVNGNPVRAGAALDLAASGTVPGEFDVIRTPASGHDVTHRVLLVLDPTAAASWHTTTPGPAAQVDPTSAALAAALLPDPANVTIRVVRVDPGTGGAGSPLSLTADTLGLDSLGWLRVAANPGELAVRIAAAARRHWAGSLGGAAATGQVRLIETPPADPARHTLAELTAAANAVRGMLQAARALTTGDLLPPTASPPEPAATVVQGTLAAASLADQHVRAVLTALQAISLTTPSQEAISTLLDAAALGVAEAVPDLTDATPAPAVLQAQGTAAASRLLARTQLPPLTPAATGELIIAAVRDRLAALLGSAVLLPTPVAMPADPALRGDLAGTSRRDGADPGQLRCWLYDHARLRPALAAALDAFDLADGLHLPARLDVHASQLPSDAAPWAGNQAVPPPGITGLLVVHATGTALPDPVAGLVLDSWVQTVPGPDCDTGLSFHYDEPNATPPQAILVATAPDITAGRTPDSWDLDTLAEIVTATMALAADRAVAADLVPGVAITLPDTPA